MMEMVPGSARLPCRETPWLLSLKSVCSFAVGAVKPVIVFAVEPVRADQHYSGCERAMSSWRWVPEATDYDVFQLELSRDQAGTKNAKAVAEKLVGCCSTCGSRWQMV